uniref:Uncharacterized protein n=1 Tax=Arundo donax TaxID=35708 RepID=A0A0A9BCX4_ARUDO
MICTLIFTVISLLICLNDTKELSVKPFSHPLTEP